MKKLYLPLLLATISALILLAYYLIQGSLLDVESYGREYSILWQPWWEPHNVWMPELSNFWNVLAVFALAFSSTALLKSLPNKFSHEKFFSLIAPAAIMIGLLLLIKTGDEPWSGGGKLGVLMFFFFFMLSGYEIINIPGESPEKRERRKEEFGLSQEFSAGVLIAGQIFIVWLMIFKEPLLQGQGLIASYFIIAVGIGFFFGLLRYLCILAVTWMFRGLKYYE